MFNSAGNLSLADIAAATKNNDGFGGNNGWWVIIILLALFGGFGGNGYGNNRNDCAAEVQRGFDTSTITSQLNGINNGICSLGYDQLNQMNGINANINSVFRDLESTFQQMAFSLQQQLSNCCCENREAIAQVRYDMATNTCAITTAISNAMQAIMQNDNNNYRTLHDENVAAAMAAKDAKIAEQASLINALNLSASQANQNNELMTRFAALLKNNNCGCSNCGC